MQLRLSTIIIIVCFLALNGLSMTAMSKEVTLREKIGQMLLFGFQGTELKADDMVVQDILAQRIGGVVLFDMDAQTKTPHRNIKDPVQLRKLTQQLQDYTEKAATKNQNSLYPLLIAIDYEGGHVTRLKENYGFSKTLSAAEIGQGSYEQAYQYAELMAETLQQAGINMNFAPVVDVNVNPENPIIGKLGRGFSSDPHQVTEYAAIFSEAYQKHGILCVYKHFPGHGSSLGDTHLGMVDVTKTWKEYELVPFKELFNKEQHCPIVMTAHVVHTGLDADGYPASLSKSITTKLLRQDLGFDGVVITDAMQMKAITDHYGTSEAVKLAINAGADILIFDNQLSAGPHDAKWLVEIIYEDVKSGKIPESRINESYHRIMQLKKKLPRA